MAKQAKVKGYADIIMSIPWQCGESDCKAQWHMSNYWTNSGVDTGYTVDSYADGDHESIDESDLPSDVDYAKAWRAYHEHVLATGQDPLGEFVVKPARKVRERWEFRFNNSILGYVLIAARRAGKRVDARDLPAHVVEYLNLDKQRRVLGDFSGPEGRLEFAKLFPSPNKWNVQHIEATRARNPGVVAGELKAAARKALKRPDKAAG